MVIPVFCWQLPFSLPLVLLESLYLSCDKETEGHLIEPFFLLFSTFTTLLDST